MDVKNAELVVQFGAPKSLNALTQRWGRAARQVGVRATVVMIAEPAHFKEVRDECETNKARAQAKAQAKQPAVKRAALEGLEADNELLKAADGPHRKRRRIDSFAAYTSDPVVPEGDVGADSSEDDNDSSFHGAKLITAATPAMFERLKDPILALTTQMPTQAT